VTQAMPFGGPLSTSGGQPTEVTANALTDGNSVPNTARNGTHLVTDAKGRPAYLSGSGRILIGPHAGTSLMEWALRYAEHGFHVFPLRPGTKSGYYAKCARCKEDSPHYDADAHADGVRNCRAHPAGYARCHGLYAATTNPDIIRSWWLEDAFSNIGINCEWSNIVLLDTDVTNGKQGDVNLAAVEKKHESLLAGPQARTSSGGQHRLFRPPPGVTVRSSTGALAPGVDIKATGGLMIAAPSIVADDKTRLVKGQYVWMGDPWQEIPELPMWVLEEIERNKTKAHTPRPSTIGVGVGSADVQDRVIQLADEAATASEGHRNNVLFRNAVKAFEYALTGQIDADEAEFIFEQAGLRADPGAASQIRATVASARRKAVKPYTWRTWGNAAPVGMNSDAADGATREGQDVTETAEIPEQRGETPSGTFYSNPDAPMKVARDLEHLWTTAQGKTLYHWRETWMQYTGTHWAETGVSTIKSQLYLKLEDALYITTNKKGETETKPWNPNIGKIANLVEAISAVTHLDDRVETGTWMGRDGEKGLISCKNCLVNPITRVTQGHTPAYFTTTSVPYAYDPNAGCGQWLAFLGEVFGDDTESIQAIQEWAGYVLSGRTDLQKGIQLIGPPRAGKGTVARIIEKLIGKENATGTTLGDIGRQFGLAPLVGKSLCVIGDAHMENRAMAAIVTRLLMIMGEDTITVDRKNRSEWEGKMSARMMMLANKPPKFSDASGAIVSRWITVKFTQSFEGREDETLETRLTAELPGIFNWALDGLKRLTERGRFVQPTSSLETVRTQRENASPVTTFVEESCVTGEGHWVVKAALFEAWKTWCMANNVQAVGTTAQFATDLYAAVAGVSDGKQRRIAGTPMRCFGGITLRTPEGMMTPATQSGVSGV
jgi:putative DNA primase/helicase